MRNDIAIQMYSLKDITKENYLNGFKLVSELGFKNIELAGDYGLSANEFKSLCDEYGLKVVSAHIGGENKTTEEINKIIEFQSVLGNKMVVCPWSPCKDLESTKLVAKSLKRMQDIYVSEGFTFGYHNHAFEFDKVDGDLRIIDILAAEGVKLQPDLYWVKVGGVEPIDFMKKYKDQIVSLHFKEYGANNTNPEFGEGGILDWQAIMDFGKQIGVEYNILEQEEYSLPVADSIALCAKNLNEMFK